MRQKRISKERVEKGTIRDYDEKNHYRLFLRHSLLIGKPTKNYPWQYANTLDRIEKIIGERRTTLDSFLFCPNNS